MNDERREEEVVAMLSLDPEDPARVQWEKNPENRALAEAYRSFVECDAGDVSEREVTELARSLPKSPAGPRRARRPSPSRFGSRAAMAASIAVLAVGVWLISDVLRGPGVEVTGHLRGDASTRVIDATVAAVEDGRLRVSWTPIAEADTYVIEILDADLRELRRIESDGETASIEIDEVEGGAWFLVEAQRDGQTLQRSAPQGWDRR